MLFHLYGEKTNPAIVLLPDSCCHWKKLFDEAATLLSRDYYVAVAAYDGFDPERPDAVFADVPTEANCIAAFIENELGGKAKAVYGCGFGGRVAVLVAQRTEGIEHLVIDGTDFSTIGNLMAGTAARAVAKGFMKLYQKGELTDDMKKMLDGATDEGRAYLLKLFDAYGAGTDEMAFVQKASVHNQLLVANTYNVGREVEIPEAKVHVMCPMASGPEFLDDSRRFPGADVRKYNAAKLEMLLCFPQTWVDEICAICRQ